MKFCESFFRERNSDVFLCIFENHIFVVPCLICQLNKILYLNIKSIYRYNERKNYDFTNPGFSEDTQQFTQLVWKDTTLVGVAIVENSCGPIRVVAHYSSAGNIDGQYDDNVSPRKGKKNG